MKQIEKLLPGYNCGECGLGSCREFAAALVDVADLDRCTILKQERFQGRAEQIAELLATSEKMRRSSASWMVCGRTSLWLHCRASPPAGRTCIHSIPKHISKRATSSDTGRWAAQSLILPGFSSTKRELLLFIWSGRSTCCRDCLRQRTSASHGCSLRGSDKQGQEAGGGRNGALSARALHDAKGALRGDCALRGEPGEDRGDRSEGVVAKN